MAQSAHRKAAQRAQRGQSRGKAIHSATASHTQRSVLSTTCPAQRAQHAQRTEWLLMHSCSSSSTASISTLLALSSPTSKLTCKWAHHIMPLVFRLAARRCGRLCVTSAKKKFVRPGMRGPSLHLTHCSLHWEGTWQHAWRMCTECAHFMLTHRTSHHLTLSLSPTVASSSRSDSLNSSSQGPCAHARFAVVLYFLTLRKRITQIRRWGAVSGYSWDDHCERSASNSQGNCS